MKKIFIVVIVIIVVYVSNMYFNDNKIKVDIKGAVISPGVYEVNDKMTISDLILLAGGLRSDADTSNINLTDYVMENDTLVIPTIETSMNDIEVIEKESVCPKIVIEDNLININKASIEELSKLPSIGISKATAIVKYRESKEFDKIEDIMNVKGIGKAIYDKIKDLIRV